MRSIQYLEDLITRLGRAVAWLLLVMVTLQAAIVLLRYGFDIGSIALQESVTYLHATTFMLGAAFTLQMDGHVRVDIFYRNLGERHKARVDLFGNLVFLLPLCIVILWTSIDYVAQSWSIREGSSDPGGIAGVFLLKSLIPLLAGSLLLQSLASTLRHARTIFTSPSNTHSDHA